MCRKLIESWCKIYELKLKKNEAALKLQIENHAMMVAKDSFPTDNCSLAAQRRKIEKFSQSYMDVIYEKLGALDASGKTIEFYKKCLDALSA